MPSEASSRTSCRSHCGSWRIFRTICCAYCISILLLVELHLSEPDDSTPTLSRGVKEAGRHPITKLVFRHSAAILFRFVRLGATNSTGAVEEDWRGLSEGQSYAVRMVRTIVPILMNGT